MSRMSVPRDAAARSTAACARSASALSVLEPPAALFEGRARPLQLGERLLSCDDAIGVHLCERAQDARGLPDLPDVGGGEQKAQVAALSHLVDVHQAGLQFRPARGFLLLEVLHPLTVCRELC